MPWPAAFESAFAISILKILAKQLADFAITEIDNFWNVDRNLTELITNLAIVQRKLVQLENEELARGMWRPLFQYLTKIIYDVDDILDGIKLDIMIEANLQQQAANSHVVDQHCGSSIISTLLNPFRGRTGNRSVNNHAIHASDQHQVRVIILSNLKKWRVPHRISKLQNKLRETEGKVDRLLLLAAPNRPSNEAHSRPTRSFPHNLQVLAPGRELEKMAIIKEYLINQPDRGKGISIVGMAGIGKTELANAIYSNTNIRQCFDHVKWVTVAGEFPSLNALFQPVEQDHMVNGYPVPVYSQAIVFYRWLTTSKIKKKILCVLDNLCKVRHEDWEKLCASLSASQVTFLITTRDHTVASITGTTPYYLNSMRDDDCKVLIKSKLPDLSPHYDRRIARIAKKCGGLPSVANLLGHEIRSKCSSGEEPDQAISHFEKIDLWDLRTFRDEIICSLGYNSSHLPQELTSFLFYLTLFPPGHQLKRHELYQLWMAEGFVQPEEWTASGFATASQYFDDLLSWSMLHCAGSSQEDNMMLTYQILEFTQRFAESIASNACYQMKEGEEKLFMHCTYIRHLSLCRQDIEPHHLEVIGKYYRRLRTIHLFHRQGTHITEMPHSFFQQQHFLRVLNLSQSRITALPTSIGNLKHLRYLDASDTPIQNLPDRTCELLGLRIIKLKNCRLRYLPENIGNLVNLICLDVDMKKMCYTPPNLGKLVNLQALHEFKVKKNKGHHLTELKNMNALRGSIRIIDLENVQNIIEAQSSNLAEKSDLITLELQWTESSMPEPVFATNVLNALQPHINLEELKVTNYSGTTFPDWISNPSRYLKSIHLYNCPKSTELPPFWQLPLLKTLSIDTVSELRHVGPQFFGNSKRFGFLELEHLEFSNMEKLVKWENPVSGDMPRLRDLKIVRCPMLSTMGTLHHLTSLRDVEIDLCPNLVQRPRVHRLVRFDFNRSFDQR